MKRLLLILTAVFTALSLTSCAMWEVHWFDKTYYAPWYIVLIPTVIICVVAHTSIVNKEYRCPECGNVFKPKWYEIRAWLHNGKERAVKCPQCGRCGMCPPNDE